MKYIFLIIAIYPAYLLFNFAVDTRIEKLRPYLTMHMVETCTESAVKVYAKRYEENESLLQKKREARDAKLKEWVYKFNEILEMK